MKRPKTSESKYWDNDNRFRHLLFIEDLENYTTALEEMVEKKCSIPDVIKSVCPECGYSINHFSMYHNKCFNCGEVLRR